MVNATGTVKFFINDAEYGTEFTVVNGSVSGTISGLRTDANKIYAVYSGDDNYVGSTSETADFVVLLVDPAISQSVRGIRYGQNLRVNVTVPTDVGEGTVTITLYNNDTKESIMTETFNLSEIQTF